jgi:predicted RNA-binding Zn-ribbon protein involved in translation (DUF1610 family)
MALTSDCPHCGAEIVEAARLAALERTERDGLGMLICLSCGEEVFYLNPAVVAARPTIN